MTRVDHETDFMDFQLTDALAISAGFAVILLLAWAAMGLVIASQLLSQRVHRCETKERPQNRGFQPVALEIFADDRSHRIAGWLIRPPGTTQVRPDPSPETDTGPPEPLPCVVMIHGFGSNKDCLWTFPDDPQYRGSMMDQGADSLCRAGFCVVAIDLRNHGESGRCGFITLGNHEAHDVTATIDYLRRHAERLGIDPRRIGLRGESMGAATCLIAAARDRENRVSAVWCDSSFADAEWVISDFLTYAGVTRSLAPAVGFGCSDGPASGWPIPARSATSATFIVRSCWSIRRATGWCRCDIFTAWSTPIGGPPTGTEPDEKGPHAKGPICRRLGSSTGTATIGCGGNPNTKNVKSSSSAAIWATAEPDTGHAPEPARPTRKSCVSRAFRVRC